MIRDLVSALRTLTVLPVPGKDTSEFTRSLPWFGLVGALLSCIVIVLIKGLLFLFPSYPLLIGIFTTLCVALLTGAIHFDGGADCADGFGGGRTRERILEIFKDSRLGTFGVFALVTDILLRVILYSTIVQFKMWTILIVTMVFSRIAQSLALVYLPYAGSSKGTALVFTAPKSKVPAILSAAIFVVICLFIADVKFGLIALLSSIIVSLFFLRYCFVKIGGITGDCIGALNEIVEIVCLLSALIMIRFF